MECCSQELNCGFSVLFCLFCFLAKCSGQYLANKSPINANMKVTLSLSYSPTTLVFLMLWTLTWGPSCPRTVGHVANLAANLHCPPSRWGNPRQALPTSTPLLCVIPGLPGMKARFIQGTSALLFALASGTIIAMDKDQLERRQE